MLWYVLQTKTGQEEKLAELIPKMIPKNLYEECFVIYQEQLWRRKQQNFVHVRPAFPGYVFITSKDPEALFFCLKRIPIMAKMMVDEECFFLSVEKEESEFLDRLMNENHVICLSYLSTDGRGKILHVSGPLKECVDGIIKCRYGKRHVLVRVRLHGEEKTVLFGVVLKEDICEGLQHVKVNKPKQFEMSGKGEKAGEMVSVKNLARKGRRTGEGNLENCPVPLV
ncbi:MAG: hypothetical protein HFG53_13665 [Lachnospiraceae bacterium]|nr:hypothetical protein [Lachnospiraceae bacterium]